MLDRPAFPFRQIQGLICLLRGASPDSSICPCRSPALLIRADARRELSTISAKIYVPHAPEQCREFQRPRPSFRRNSMSGWQPSCFHFSGRFMGFGEQGANHL